MNPVVLIATHARLLITKKNIDCLLRQSVTPKIILVVSDLFEANAFISMFPEIHVIMEKNIPLGAKWQAGVNKAKEIGADPLIISGSDDFLCKGFIENAIQSIQNGYDFIGLRRWIVFDLNKKRGYDFEYKSKMPLGGGRIYSKNALEKLNYCLFDTGKDMHLDDFGWNAVLNHSLTYMQVNRSYPRPLNIVAVKGDWPSMNPIQKHFGHANTRLVCELDAKQVYDIIDYEI